MPTSQFFRQTGNSLALVVAHHYSFVSMKGFRLFLNSCALLALVSQAQAYLLFFDSFSDYSSASLEYQMGGLGGKGYWGFSDWPPGYYHDTGQSRYSVASGALVGNITTYSKRVVVQTVSTNCEIQRKLGISLGEDGTTRYLRLLLRADYAQGSLWPSGSYLGIELRKGANSAVYVGKGNSGTFAIGRAAQNSYVSAASTFVASTTYVLVLKMQFQSGNDVLTLYINPSASQEPASGTTRSDIDLGTPNLLCLVANLSMSVDDIAIADGYSDAMSVSSLPTIPTISMNAGGTFEGDTGVRSLAVAARLSSPVGHKVAVDFKTYNGNAVGGQDFVASEGTLVFEPHSTTATTPIGIMGDTAVETNESFYVGLSWPVSSKFQSGVGAGAYFVITNDDVTLLSPLRISGSGAGLSLSWAADANVYGLEVATNLPATSWNTVGSVQQTQMSSSNFLFQTTQPRQTGSRFFRLHRPF